MDCADIVGESVGVRLSHCFGSAFLFIRHARWPEGHLGARLPPSSQAIFDGRR